MTESPLLKASLEKFFSNIESITSSENRLCSIDETLVCFFELIKGTLDKYKSIKYSFFVDPDKLWVWFACAFWRNDDFREQMIWVRNCIEFQQDILMFLVRCNQLISETMSMPEDKITKITWITSQAIISLGKLQSRVMNFEKRLAVERR